MIFIYGMVFRLHDSCSWFAGKCCKTLFTPLVSQSHTSTGHRDAKCKCIACKFRHLQLSNDFWLLWKLLWWCSLSYFYSENIPSSQVGPKPWPSRRQWDTLTMKENAVCFARLFRLNVICFARLFRFWDRYAITRNLGEWGGHWRRKRKKGKPSR